MQDGRQTFNGQDRRSDSDATVTGAPDERDCTQGGGTVRSPSQIEEQREDNVTDDSSSESTSTPPPQTASIVRSQSGAQGNRSLSPPASQSRDGIEAGHDPGHHPKGVDIGSPLSEKQPTGHSEPVDPNLVTWTGPDDPDNPKQWSFKKKWAAVTIVSAFTLISPVSSSMVAPSLTAIGEELHTSSAFEEALILSIFILAYAVGPLIWGPLSELYGRVIVLQLTNLLYFFFNLGCGLSKTKQQLIAFRFLSGLGGSAPLAIGGGVLADLFAAEQRGRALSLYILMPLLGPAVGPIAGGFITQQTTWRWSFYATTIADGLVQVMGLFLLRETYAPVLLSRKRRKLVKETGNTALHTAYDNPDRTITTTLRIAFTRPFRLLSTQIIVQCLALCMMYLYGLMYIVLSTFPSLWSRPLPQGYGMDVGIGGLNYISLGLGFFLGAQICARLQDRIYGALKRRSPNGAGRPEFRVPMMIPGAVLVPVGLLIYGWTAQYKTHWIGPNIGACLYATGSIIGFQCVQGFLVDTYPRYAASAVGATTVLRSLAGFGFPLFAPSLYDRLDYGWGNTVMAMITVVIGWPVPILLWFYGERLRERSPFAAGG